MIYDKRKLKRYDVFLIVEFKPLRSPGGFSIGITRDLSPEGFSLETQTIECQRGDIMEFRLKHPDADWTVNISGKVIWRNNSWYKYVIGIEFLKVNEEQNAKLLNLMSAIMDAENNPGLIVKDTESLPKTEKEKMPEAMGAKAIDVPIPDTFAANTNRITLKNADHCELTGSEKFFIAGDVFVKVSDNGKEDTDDSEKQFKESVRDIELTPEPEQISIDNKAVEAAARTNNIEEAAPEYKKIYTVNFDAVSGRDTVQTERIIDAEEKSRKKKLWLYVPAAMIILIILVIALPKVIEKFNHPSVPALTEPETYSNTEKDEYVPAADNMQTNSPALNEPSAPPPVQNAKTDNALPVEREKAENLQQLFAKEEPAGIQPPKSEVVTEVKNQKTEYAAKPAEANKTIINTLQINNANIVRPETAAGSKPLQDKIEKSRKIDLIANIDETLNNLRAIQNEKPQEKEVVIETKKMPEDKPIIVKTEEQPPAVKVVKPEEKQAAAVTEIKKIPAVEQEVTAREEKKQDIIKAEPAVKTREMPKVVLMVKRDKSRNISNNSSDTAAVSTTDLLKKWKHIGSTNSGIPLFIAPDNISYPYEHVVNLLVKASVNKKDFVDMLAINCSQIKLRILEERNGNNPVFTSYSNEWKDINPDSMILYNSACPEKK